MKSKNILIVSAFASVLWGCVYSGAHYSEESYPPEAEPDSGYALIGIWDQTCGQQHGSIRFDTTMFQSTMGRKTRTGSWKINENNKLILLYGGGKREKWTIQNIHEFEYTLVKGKVTCQGWKKG